MATNPILRQIGNRILAALSSEEWGKESRKVQADLDKLLAEGLKPGFSVAAGEIAKWMTAGAAINSGTPDEITLEKFPAHFKKFPKISHSKPKDPIVKALEDKLREFVIDEARSVAGMSDMDCFGQAAPAFNFLALLVKKDYAGANKLLKSMDMFEKGYVPREVQTMLQKKL